MNKLVIVKKKIYKRKIDMIKNRPKVRWTTKNVKMYLNDLLNPETYVLNIIGKDIIRVDYLKDHMKDVTITELLTISWAGMIKRSKNKKLFDNICQMIRIVNE